MSWAAEIRERPVDYVSVKEYPSGFLPIHTKDNKTKRLSKKIETDKKIATAAAMAYSAKHNIPFVSAFGDSERTVVTVLEREKNNWFPALILKDKIALIISESTESNQSNSENSFEQAVTKAKDYAKTIDGIFIQSLGMKLGEELKN